MRFLESSNSQKQKAERWFPEAGEKESEEVIFSGDRVSVLQDDQNSGDG